MSNLVGLVRGKQYGTVGIEIASSEPDEVCNGSCKSGSGGSFCVGYRGHAICGKDVVIYCQDPKFFDLPAELRLGMIQSEDRDGELLNFG